MLRIKLWKAQNSIKIKHRYSTKIGTLEVKETSDQEIYSKNLIPKLIMRYYLLISATPMPKSRSRDKKRTPPTYPWVENFTKTFRLKLIISI
jgi:hypothetical protein